MNGNLQSNPVETGSKTLNEPVMRLSVNGIVTATVSLVGGLLVSITTRDTSALSELLLQLASMNGTSTANAQSAIPTTEAISSATGRDWLRDTEQS